MKIMIISTLKNGERLSFNTLLMSLVIKSTCHVVVDILPNSLIIIYVETDPIFFITVK